MPSGIPKFSRRLVELQLNQKKETVQVLPRKGIPAVTGYFKIWLFAFVLNHFGIKLLNPWVAHLSSVITLRLAEWSSQSSGKKLPTILLSIYKMDKMSS